MDVNGVYKPTYNWGGTTLYQRVISSIPSDSEYCTSVSGTCCSNGRSKSPPMCEDVLCCWIVEPLPSWSQRKLTYEYIPIPSYTPCASCVVYLPTKLGDFGQGQMLVNIPAPWSRWVLEIPMYIICVCWTVNQLAYVAIKVTTHEEYVCQK